MCAAYGCSRIRAGVAVAVFGSRRGPAGHGPTSPSAPRWRPTAAASSTWSSRCRAARQAAPPDWSDGRASLPRAEVAALRSAGAGGDEAAQPAVRRATAKDRRRRRRGRSRTRPGRSAARTPREDVQDRAGSASPNRTARAGRASSSASASSTRTSTGRRRCSRRRASPTPNICDRERLKQAAEREVQARFVPPGNVVPLYFGGHPGGGSRGRSERRSPRDPGGRVHLALQRDPASGAESVALTAPVFEEAWQNEVAAAAANTAHGILAGAPTPGGARSRWRATRWTATSRLIDGLLARAPAGAVACRAGCDHCCYQSVGVTPPEALAIFDHLSRTLSDAQLGERRGARRRARARDARAVDRRAVLARASLRVPATWRRGGARSTRSGRSRAAG